MGAFIPALIKAMPQIVSGVAALGSQLLNNRSIKRNNQAMLMQNNAMYDRQRNDALADWNRMNAYNSPQAQMQRFKQAGLNPNLIYGQSNEGATIRSSDFKGWNPTPPQFDLGGIAKSALFTGVDLKQREANVQNTEQVVKNNEAKERETEAKTLNIIGNTKKTDLQNQRYNEIVDSQLSVMQANADKQKAETDQVLTKTEQMKAIFSPGLQKAYLEVQKLRLENAKTQAERISILQDIENKKKDEELKRLDIELKRIGIMPGDNLFMRLLGRQLANPKDQTWHKENKPNKVMDR